MKKLLLFLSIFTFANVKPAESKINTEKSKSEIIMEACSLIYRYSGLINRGTSFQLPKAIKILNHYKTLLSNLDGKEIEEMKRSIEDLINKINYE